MLVQVPVTLAAGWLLSAAAAQDAPTEFAHETTLQDAGHRWSATFTNGHVAIRPDLGGWSLGLSFKGLGRDGDVVRFGHQPAPVVDGNRVTYAWGTGLEEWFIQDVSGIEHGWTLLEAPASTGCSGRLALDLSIGGDLVPRISADGRDVRFHAGGAAAFDYTGLTVFDVTGRELPAEFQTTAEGLRISIDDTAAEYPLTVDPLLQRAYLKASVPDAGDRFGWSVAATGDFIAVGAPFEDGSDTGFGGDAADDGATDAGAVYLYSRSGTTWAFEDYVKAFNAGAGDEFGAAVVMEGDLMAVGAPGESSSATGVDGNGADGSMPGAGAVYVFRRTAGVWSEEAYLKASNTGAMDRFGAYLALDGERLVVGAPGEASAIPTDPTDDGAPSAGAAYVFDYDGATGAWLAPVYLKPSSPDSNDLFGAAVAVDGNTVAVGAYQEDGNSLGFGGDETNDLAPDSGAVFLFEPMGTAWVQREYIKAGNAGPGDQFGRSVALGSGVLVAGAPFEDGGVPGIDGDGTDNSQFSAGAAYTFTRFAGPWVQEAYIKASNPGSSDVFGLRVDIDGSLLVIGGTGERSSATGINGDQTNNGAGFSGAAYLFSRQMFPWGQIAFIKASNTDSLDSFCGSVDLSEGVLVVGASREDSFASGVNGSQFDNSLADSGAAYAFDVFGGAITSYCTAQANSTGGAGTMSSTGSASVSANDLVLAASGLPTNSFGFFLVSKERGFVANPAGSTGDLCLGGAIGRYVGPGEIQNSGAAGAFSLPIDVTAVPQPLGFEMIFQGSAWHFQAWYRDAIGGSATSNFTNGRTVLFAL